MKTRMPNTLARALRDFFAEHLREKDKVPLESVPGSGRKTRRE